MHIPRWVRPDAARSLALECCLRDNDPTHLLHTGVIMPDHMHLIFTPVDSENHKMYSWAEIMGGIKWRRRSLSVANWVVRGRVWQRESFDRVLRSSEDLDAKLAYIPDHPVRDGLVYKREGYLWTWRRPQHPYAVAEPPRCARRDSRGGCLYVSLTRDLPVSAAAPLRPSTTHQTASG